MIARLVLRTGLSPDLFLDDEWGPHLIDELARQNVDHKGADLLRRLHAGERT